MTKVYLFHQLADVKQAVKMTEGKTFKVWFVKDDDTLRKMKCHVDLKYKPKPKEPGKVARKLPPTSVFVFDEKKQEYRSFNAGRVVYFYQPTPMLKVL